MWIRTAGKMLAILLGISVTSAGVQAGQQYYAGTGHWYEAVHTPEGITWGDASTAATARGGHLATVHSDGENQFILGLVNDSRYWNMDPEHTPWGPWLGGYQASGSAEPSAGWQWVTGESFSYTNWRPPQPDNGWEIEDRLHMYDSFPGGSGRWNDQCGSWPLNSYIVEYPANSSPKQNCYLDFSSYTAPTSYGSMEQIAADVKASVANKFSQDGLVFYTSFDGVAPDPSITSTIHFGGTDPTSTKLGYGEYDPGNATRNDNAYIYTDQGLFSSMPVNSTEYKNMLANVAAHEAGHLLGYSHADAAGMPFMASGDMIEAGLLQEMGLGELGQATQARRTYVSETDFNLSVDPLSIVYIDQGTRTAGQYEAELGEFNQFMEDHGMTPMEYAEFAICSFSDMSLFLKAASYGLDSVACLALQAYNDPDRPIAEYLPILGNVLFLFGNSNLDTGSQSYAIEPTWSEEHQAWLYSLDSVPTDFLEDATLSFYLGFGEDGSDTLRFYVLDAGLNSLNENYLVAANVPEPATLSLLVCGGFLLLRHKKR